jgi:oligopeptide transport system ATP-binding protein
MTKKDLSKDILLDVKNLSVSFTVHGGEVAAVRDVSFNVRRGETLCIVGESGSGKSVTTQAVMGILPTPPARIASGQALFEGQDLLKMPAKKRREIVGGEIAMIFQDPLVSLNPTMNVHDQIAETLIIHRNMTKAQRRARVLELLELVRVPEPERRAAQFPHELSGGMRQRVMIAMALACNPKLLIADEPTTALDVTIQAQVLALIADLTRDLGMSTILITHDLGVVARMADRVAVMYAGKIVEEGDVFEVFERPKHPYTLGLQRAMPKEHGASDEPLTPIPGTPPDLFKAPAGCAFAPRCGATMVVCRERHPVMEHRGDTRVACWIQHEKAAVQRAALGLATLAPEAAQGGI